VSSRLRAGGATPIEVWTALARVVVAAVVPRDHERIRLQVLDSILAATARRSYAIGLSVPAMPRGSPGMEGPAYGGAHDPYDVFLIRRDGSAAVYQSYR
jgi:hypothetical protein